MTTAAPAELSRPVAIDRATALPHVREIVATEDERAALARRLGLLALDRLSARLTWRREAGGVIRLEGELDAEVTQSCVVTLEPVAARVTDRFVRHFVRGEPRAETEVVVDPEAEDPPEALEDGLVDLGEIVTQQLALALDPYPRAPGSALPAEAARAAPAESPFRVLAALKTGR
jgi:uncharacterized metal-binding protein YceD (DUF177 family)